MNPQARIGPYRILRKLGQGGMGVVYEVEDPDMPRVVALKLINKARAGRVALERFWREADVLSRVHHRNVVRIHETGEAREGPYLVMERIEGQSLDTVVERGPLDPKRAAGIVREVADALEAIHAQGILHRDLKPANIMLKPGDLPVLLDFGLARDENAEQLTKTGQSMGTVSYMSPEQARGASPSTLGPSTDIYGLGVVLYELLLGRPPFEGSLISVIASIIQQEPTWPREERSDLPSGLDAMVRVAMAKDPADRYPSAAELRDDLDRFLHGASTHADRAPAPRGRSPLLLVGILVLLLGLIGGGLVVVTQGPSSEEVRAEVEALDDEAWTLLCTEGLLADAAPRCAELEARLAALPPPEGEAVKQRARARARVQTARVLSALIEGERPATPVDVSGDPRCADLLTAALAATDADADAAKAALGLTTAMNRGVRFAELRLWRAQALSHSASGLDRTDAILADLDALEKHREPGDVEIALRIQALLAADRVAEARSALARLEAPDPDLRWSIALPRLRRLLERHPTEAADLLTDLPKQQRPDPQRAVLAQRCLELAQPLVPRVEDGGKEEQRLVAFLHAARLLDGEARPSPPMIRDLLEIVTRYGTGMQHIELAIALAELTPDHLVTQKQIGFMAQLNLDSELRDRLLPFARRAAEIAPTPKERLDMQVGLCALLESMHREDECFELANRLLPQLKQPDPRSRVLRARATCLLSKKRYEDALGDLEEAEALVPGDSVVHHARAMTLERLERIPEARAAATKFITLNAVENSTERDRCVLLLWRTSTDRPADAELLEAMGHLLHGRRRKTHAAWWVRGAWLQLASGSPDQATETLRTCLPWLGESRFKHVREIQPLVEAILPRVGSDPKTAEAKLLEIVNHLESKRQPRHTLP